MTSDPSPADPTPPGSTPPSEPPAVYQAPQYPYGYQAVPHRPTNGLAIASLVTSAVLLISCTPLSFIGAILGHMARRQIRERDEDGDGLALAGVILGWLGPLLVVIAVAALVALAFSTAPPACGCTPIPTVTSSFTPGV